MKENRQISALLVDDHDLVLQGLKRILEYAVPEIKMICKVSSGKEALSLIDIQPFELFLLDVELPDMSGIDLIASIRKNSRKLASWSTPCTRKSGSCAACCNATWMPFCLNPLIPAKW